MNKKVIRVKSQLSKKVITLTIDERLNGVDEKKLSARKLAQVNRDLKGVKLPL